MKLLVLMIVTFCIHIMTVNAIKQRINADDKENDANDKIVASIFL